MAREKSERLSDFGVLKIKATCVSRCRQEVTRYAVGSVVGGVFLTLYEGLEVIVHIVAMILFVWGEEYRTVRRSIGEKARAISITTVGDSEGRSRLEIFLGSANTT